MVGALEPLGDGAIGTLYDEHRDFGRVRERPGEPQLATPQGSVLKRDMLRAVLDYAREVVLDLTERGAIELASQLGAQLRSVSGRVSTVSPERYGVSVTQTTSRGGVETIWRGESASIPRTYVDRLYERRLDRKRTWIVVGLTFVGAVLAGEAFGIDTGLDGLLGGGGKGSRQ